MFEEARRSQRLSSAFLVLSGYLALIIARGYPTSLLLLPIIALLIAPIGERLDKTHPGYRRITALLNIVLIVGLPYAVLHAGLLSSVTLLVVYIQTFLLLHKKTHREHLFIFLMAFFMLLAGGVNSDDATIGIVLLLFLISAVWSLMSLEMHVQCVRWEQSFRANRETQAPPSTTFFHLSTKQSPIQFQLQISARQQARAMLLLLTGAAIAMTILFFLLVPRFEAGMFGREQAVSFQSGLSNRIDLAESGTIEQSLRPVMHVQFPDERGGRFNGPMYWRNTTFTTYGDAGWDRGSQYDAPRDKAPTTYIQQQDNPRRGIASAIGRRLWSEQSDTVRQRVYIDDIRNNTLPCIDTPLSVELLGSMNASLRWDRSNNRWPGRSLPVQEGIMRPAQHNDLTVRVAYRGVESLEYEAVSELYRPSPAQLRAAPTDYENRFRPFDRDMLFNHGLAPESIALAQEITSGLDTPYDKAIAIQDWLQSGLFLYSLEVDVGTGERPVHDFLYRTRKGHCELFASTMALMLRSLGIPTRVVNGYRGGDWSEADHSYMVRASMAHLWLEVYFIDYGWIRFDPSPPAPQLNLNIFARFSADTQRRLLLARMFWHREVVGYNKGLSAEGIKTISLGLVQATRGFLTSQANEQSRVMGIGAIGVLMLLTVLLILFLLIRSLLTLTWERKIRALDIPLVLSPEQTRARRLYRHLYNRLHRLGMDRVLPTADEIALYIQDRHPHLAAAMTPILHAYQTARFGGRDFTPSQYNTLKRAIKKLRPQSGKST